MLFQEIYRAYNGESLEPSDSFNFVSYFYAADEKARKILERCSGGVSEPTEFAFPSPLATAKSTGFVLTRHSTQDTASTAAAAKYHGVTLASFTEAAWALVLARYCTTRDVVFGVTHSGRTGDFDRVIGMMVNTLPYRVRVDWETGTVGKLLEDVQRLSEGVVEHQRTSLADIQSYTEHGRSMFQSILVFENYETADNSKANFIFKKRRCVKAPNFLGISTQQAQNWNSPLSLTRQYSSHYVDLLAADYDAVVSDSSLVQTMRVFAVSTYRAGYALVDAGNATAASAHKEWQDTRPCHHAFSERAAQYPNKVAVVDGTSGKQISYKELDSKSSALALKLVSLGVQKDTIVGLLSARSIVYLIGMLGVMKAGGAYLPMDPKVPQDRIEFQLTDSSCNICLVNGLSLKVDYQIWGATLRLDTFDYSKDRWDAPHTFPQTRSCVIYEWLHGQAQRGTPRALQCMEPDAAFAVSSSTTLTYWGDRVMQFWCSFRWVCH